MRPVVHVSLMLVALTSTWTVQQGGAYWVGPVWGYDGVDSSDDYTFDERKRVQADDSSMTYMKRYVTALAKREQDDRLMTFYCKPSDTKVCKMGGKGPNIFKRLSANMAICVCFCPTGYAPKKGCLS